MTELNPDEIAKYREYQKKRDNNFTNIIKNISNKTYILGGIIIVFMLFLVSIGKMRGDDVWLVLLLMIGVLFLIGYSEKAPSILTIDECMVILKKHIIKRQQAGGIVDGEIVFGRFKLNRFDTGQFIEPDAFEIGFIIYGPDGQEYPYSAEVIVMGDMQSHIIAEKERPEGFDGKGATNKQTEIVVIQDSKWKQYMETGKIDYKPPKVK